MGGSGTAGEMPRTAREHSNLGRPPQRVVADPITAMEDGMKAWISLALCGLILGAGPSSALGQGLGGSFHVGTLGLGARAAIPGPVSAHEPRHPTGAWIVLLWGRVVAILRGVRPN